MDALKLRRTTLRTAFTKAVNHLQDVAENEQLDKNKLEIAFEQLKLKNEKLRQIDESILDTLSEANLLARSLQQRIRGNRKLC
ncbi:hypothetical protein TNCT_285571 [Trichonephila clavata]|uniref:Uncharacterized protein n=1 Tax=Trichonephila clavata TaxID=2740835 RepID=A0A8X6GRV1_TRICU|nr:hypothetical protein TNCT_285571 [Trichonephila clavata]